MRNPFAIPWVALRCYIAAVRYAIPGVMIIEEKEEEEPDSSDRGRGESNQKRENLGEIPEERGAGGGRGKREYGASRGRRADGKDARGNKEKRSKRVLGRAVTIDETREKERARVGIKWGGLLISLAIHPRSVAQNYPRVLPRLIQHYEYFLLVVGVTLTAQREERDREKQEKKREGERGRRRLGGTKGSRKSGSWSGQGDVLCASYILYIRVPLWRLQREMAPYFSRLFVRRLKRRGQPRNSRVTPAESNPRTLITTRNKIHWYNACRTAGC